MTKLYKLTKTDGTTKGGMAWGEGVINSLPTKDNPKLCSTDVLHAYESLEVAAFMRHSHMYGGDVICYEAEGEVVVRDATKCGVFELTCGKAVHLPKPTIKHSVLFALLCVQKVFDNNYIEEAIHFARRGNYRDAADAAAAASTNAFYAAARAAYAAAAAADAAYATSTNAFYTAARAAYAAADAAARAGKTLNLQEIAKQVLEEV